MQKQSPKGLKEHIFKQLFGGASGFFENGQLSENFNGVAHVCFLWGTSPPQVLQEKLGLFLNFAPLHIEMPRDSILNIVVNLIRVYNL